MENALLIGMTRQMALRREMSIIATNGFKAEQPIFEQYLSRTASEDSPNDTISFVQDFGMHRDLGEGRMEVTDNPLDVAISGEGYFKIAAPEGTRYTRNGAFELDAEGRLVTRDGYPVLSAAGTGFTFGPQDGQILISGDGTISTELGQQVRLSLVTFDDERKLQKAGGTLLKTEEPEIPVENVSLLQGAVESSNVQPILEMTRMISVMQAYQSANKIVEKSDELQRQAISTLAEVN